MTTLGETTLRSVTPLGIEHTEAGTAARLRAVVETQPDELAVHDGDRGYTFLELARRAAAVRAQVLAAVLPEDVAAGRPVALLYSHDASAVAALWGILTSGRPILVLDPRTPAARLSVLAQRAGVRTVLTDATCREVAAQVAPVVLLDDADDQPAGDESTLWENPPAPTDTAAVAFTSGSTGMPKIVVNDHRMLVRDAWVNSTGTGCYGADDVVAHSLPMAFHAGLMATCAGVLTGATMRLYDVRGRGIAGLAPWVQEHGISVVQASPAILRAFVAARPGREQLRSLTSLTIAGEAAYGPDIEAARALLPEACTIRNRYGSSETGLIAEYRVTAQDAEISGALPVGSGVGDTVITLVDEDDRPVPAGESGIVTVTARSMAVGYLDNPEATAAAYRDNADGTRTYRSNDIGVLGSAGELRLLGRRDHSVKIRGYLVEPGEVDAALFSLDEVREAITIGAARSGTDTGKRLVAYVVATVERPSAAGIRKALHALLPSYMVPETIVFLDALPRTDRGKLDRAGLPEPPTVVAGRGGDQVSEWEQVVQSMWCSVLSLDTVGPDDDFFELGGDSLAAEALMSLMVKELGVPESDALTSTLVQAPTLAEFAARLHRKPTDLNRTLIPLRDKGSRPPLFLATGGGGLGVALVPVVRHLDPELPVYALQAHGLETRGLPDWSVRAAARRHVRAVRTVQPHGPYYLGGHSFGGVVALEMAQQLRQAGEEVALLVVLDSFPPDGISHEKPEEAGLKRRIKDAIGVATTGLRGTPGTDQYWRFWRQSNVLHRHYRTDPWPGDTVVLVAESPEKADRANWYGYLTGNWRMVDVPGDHVSMLRDPYAERTAAEIWAAIERTQARRDAAVGG
jgi:acyl-coenzyme A synthetase/AMP-(fatty) acid ligase/thioesterase domain-containing protein